MLSALCQQCGLCCSGALFDFLPVTAEEAEGLRAFPVRLEPVSGGRLGLRLRCGALSGACCTAYEVRPARCRQYVCHLGRELERGERSYESALAVVEEARRRITEGSDSEPLLRQYFLGPHA